MTQVGYYIMFLHEDVDYIVELFEMFEFVTVPISGRLNLKNNTKPEIAASYLAIATLAKSAPFRSSKIFSSSRSAAFSSKISSSKKQHQEMQHPAVKISCSKKCSIKQQEMQHPAVRSFAARNAASSSKKRSIQR